MFVATARAALYALTGTLCAAETKQRFVAELLPHRSLLHDVFQHTATANIAALLRSDDAAVRAQGTSAATHAAFACRRLMLSHRSRTGAE